MTKQEYINRIMRTLNRIDDLDKLARIWLFADALAVEEEAEE